VRRLAAAAQAGANNARGVWALGHPTLLRPMYLYWLLKSSHQEAVALRNAHKAARLPQLPAPTRSSSSHKAVSDTYHAMPQPTTAQKAAALAVLHPYGAIA
jgi:hypothetical protein